jgi:hypothetical protein
VLLNTTNNVALFGIGTGGAIETVLRKGIQAPGLAAEIVFNSFSSPEMNAQGELAFPASIGEPGVTGSNDETVWRQDSSGRFQLVARQGDAAADAPFTDFLRPIRFHNILGVVDQLFGPGDGGTRVHGLILFGGETGNDEGLPSGLGDAGYIAFRGYFTNAEAIYVSSKVLSVPEPNAVFIVAAAAALSLRGRREPNCATDCSPRGELQGTRIKFSTNGPAKY